MTSQPAFVTICLRRDCPPNGYDSIVDELASELEARYSRHLDHGTTDAEAWNAVIAEIRPGLILPASLRHANTRA